MVPGTRLGPYEIVAPLGAGGMGEVYKARDTRLDRDVAIKVLPSALAADPQLRDRFEREAKAISSLNHPHICTLFDVGHQDPSTSSEQAVDFLVLEYLEGETIAERLARSGALDPQAALTIAIDICDALDKAHRSGIVHRDLKPANVMLTKTGPKLLDFGLAKSAVPAITTTAVSMLPTTPPNLTAQGAILGTLQYMAPEQIEGLEADARTDIFAFGALVFEMLTGRTAFEGKTRASLLGAILKDEPLPVSRVQPVAPAALDRIISTCLAKDPDDRYQSARDLLRDLTWAASESGDGATVSTVARPSRSSRLAWLVAPVTTIASIAAAVLALRRDITPGAEPVQFTIAPPESMSFGGPRGGGTGSATQVAVSPDGQNIVFVAGAQSAYQLWRRPVAALTATLIPGTEGASFPFWSPDSASIGFFADGKLKKVAMTGGQPTVLCDAPNGRGGTWSRDNVILFSASGTSGTGGLQRVSSAGGAPTVVTTLAATRSFHRWPHFLPDGRHFFYTAATGACCPAAQPATVRIGSLDQADAAIDLFQVESSVSYSSGHVFFARDETLMAQPFDLDTRQLTGDAFPVAQQVGPEGSRYVGASVSQTGTLVYARDESPVTQLTWFDRAGRVLATLGEPAQYNNLALSPDETRVAVTMRTGNPENIDIWIVDIARNRRVRLTTDPGSELFPVWSPDGTRLAFERRGGGKVFLRQQPINDTGAGEVLIEELVDNGGGSGITNIVPTSWSADGRFIAYTLLGSFPRTTDVWALPLFGDRKPFPLVQTAFTENAAAFSPDGRWIAYGSNDGGRNDLYVRPFPGAGGKYPVSRDGGTHPAWRADGKELFYLGADGTMMAVPIDATRQFDAGVPQSLFPTGALMQVSGSHAYAVTKDGKRFLVITRPQQSSAPLTVVVNWPTSLKQ
jgi:eukaryotic-like serine/threonine-protein kinase